MVFDGLLEFKRNVSSSISMYNWHCCCGVVENASTTCVLCREQVVLTLRVCLAASKIFCKSHDTLFGELSIVLKTPSCPFEKKSGSVVGSLRPLIHYQ